MRSTANDTRVLPKRATLFGWMLCAVRRAAAVWLLAMVSLPVEVLPPCPCDDLDAACDVRGTVSAHTQADEIAQGGAESVHGVPVFASVPANGHAAPPLWDTLASHHGANCIVPSMAGSCGSCGVVAFASERQQQRIAGGDSGRLPDPMIRDGLVVLLPDVPPPRV